MNWDLRSLGIVRSVEIERITDVSQRTTCFVFSGRAVQEDCLALEDMTDRLSGNVRKKLQFYAE